MHAELVTDIVVEASRDTLLCAERMDLGLRFKVLCCLIRWWQDAAVCSRLYQEYSFVDKGISLG